MSGALTASNGLIVERHFIGSQDYFGIIHTNGYESHVWPEEYEAIKQFVAWEETRKPWHDAKPGEVWAVTWEGVESACVVELQDGCVRGRAFVPTDGKRETPGVMASIVTAGRRIWPEAVES